YRSMRWRRRQNRPPKRQRRRRRTPPSQRPAPTPSRRNPRSFRRDKRSWAMLELMLCSLFTIVPDYLFRRYWQGKRFGKEITLFSVWFELRWGITTCLILAVGLITAIFYNHPSTNNVTLFFRTVPIAPETIGRVAEVYVGMSGPVKEGQPIF